MAAKLIIDLQKFKKSDPNVQCSYKHHPDNKGVDALLEKIRFALICRKCATSPCIEACPQGALEKVDSDYGSDGEQVLKRANMLCTGCGTCAMACPFGTVYEEMIPFVGSVCDVCKGRLPAGEKPLCVQTCENNSIEYKQVSVEGDMVELFEDVVVKVSEGSSWQPFLRDTEKD